MKNKNLIITLSILVILLISDISRINLYSESQTGTYKKTFSTSERNTNSYTYERVFKDGVWWIYVYDGSVLVDFFPEE
ncbi:MAG: hypothetical protein IPM96_11560 [Ignavibacteria bacterium]|nr:hypothetical protein [Ignavibacteria bacterium]